MQTLILSVAILTAILTSWIIYQNYRYWLASTKPPINMRFDYGYTDVLRAQSDKRLPTYLYVENLGRIPCTVLSIAVDGITITGEARYSSMNEHLYSMALESGLFLQPGERIFIELGNIQEVQDHLLPQLSAKDKFFVRARTQFEQGYTDITTYKLTVRQSSQDRFRYDLARHDSRPRVPPTS